MPLLLLALVLAAVAAPVRWHSLDEADDSAFPAADNGNGVLAKDEVQPNPTCGPLCWRDAKCLPGYGATPSTGSPSYPGAPVYLEQVSQGRPFTAVAVLFLLWANPPL
jgi:hypothetical protein